MEHALDAVSAIQRQWKHLSTSVTDIELDRTKQQLRTNLLTQLSDNTGLAHWLATEVDFRLVLFIASCYFQTLGKGEPSSLSALETNIRKLDASSVRGAMSRYVYDRDLAAAGIGRTECMPPYLIMRYKQSWWRL